MRRRAGTRSARRARPRRAQAAPGSEPAAKGSLRDAAVGCPERAQVGPLPWLSKSRRAGLWSAIRTPGSLTIDCWATRTWPRPFGSRPILPVGFLGRDDLDVQLLELRLVHLRGRAEHQVRHRLRLRERDHIADVVGTAKHHHDAVDARCDYTMRRHSVGEHLEQSAEPGANQIERHAERLENSLLHGLVVHTKASV